MTKKHSQQETNHSKDNMPVIWKTGKTQDTCRSSGSCLGGVMGHLSRPCWGGGDGLDGICCHEIRRVVSSSALEVCNRSLGVTWFQPISLFLPKEAMFPRSLWFKTEQRFCCHCCHENVQYLPACLSFTPPGWLTFMDHGCTPWVMRNRSLPVLMYLLYTSTTEKQQFWCD